MTRVSKILACDGQGQDHIRQHHEQITEKLFKYFILIQMHHICIELNAILMQMLLFDGMLLNSLLTYLQYNQQQRE